MSFVENLKESIAASHTDIEKTPFAIGMVSGRIDRKAYCIGLSQLGFLHQSLESLLSTNSDFSRVYSPSDMNRADIVDLDLANLGYEETPLPHEATTRISDQLEEWAERSPWSLIGTLYVLEGSRMGSMYLARSLSKGFGLELRPGVGLDYHVDGMATRPMVWKRFKESLSSLDLSHEQEQDVLRGAVETMSMLCELYASLPMSLEVPVAV